MQNIFSRFTQHWIFNRKLEDIVTLSSNKLHFPVKTNYLIKSNNYEKVTNSNVVNWTDDYLKEFNQLFFIDHLGDDTYIISS